MYIRTCISWLMVILTSLWVGKFNFKLRASSLCYLNGQGRKGGKDQLDEWGRMQIFVVT